MKDLYVLLNDGVANLGSITNSNYRDEWPPPKVERLNYVSHYLCWCWGRGGLYMCVCVCVCIYIYTHTHIITQILGHITERHSC